eukprot:207918-Prymnesium_polylepis.2
MSSLSAWARAQRGSHRQTGPPKRTSGAASCGAPAAAPWRAAPASHRAARAQPAGAVHARAAAPPRAAPAAPRTDAACPALRSPLSPLKSLRWVARRRKWRLCHRSASA